MSFGRCVMRWWKSVAVVTVGAIASGLVAAFGSLEIQTGFSSGLVGCVAGLLVDSQTRQKELELQQKDLLESLEIPTAIAKRSRLYAEFLAIRRAFTQLVHFEHPILEEIAALKLASVNQELQSLTAGRIQFTRTETWRLVYEQLLLHHRLASYRSVAWVRSDAYWQDTPGLQSMEINYLALGRGMRIERIFILSDALLLDGQRRPRQPIHDWILDQAAHGIDVRWVLESELESESHLIGDFGIYGDTAVGEQFLDDRCRTLHFTLSFDPREIDLARARWERLELFSISLF